MKRAGNLWEKVIDIDNIKAAHRKAREEKASYDAVKEVDNNLDYYANKLRGYLVDGTLPKEEYVYKTIIDKGKPRTLSILPYFPYRVMHWAIKRVIDEYIDKTLIYHTYSGRVNKGTHNMIPYLIKSFKKYHWVMTTDILKYYDTISKRKLKYVLYRHIKDKKVLELLFRIINNYKPESKRGVPLGNSISIDFANVFLSDIDHKYTQNKNIDYYRFMDNIFIFSNNRYELKEIYFELKVLLRKRGLRLHKYNINETKNGITIIGYNYTNHKVKASDKTYRSYAKTKKRMRQNKYKYGYITKHYVMSLKSKEGFIKHFKYY